MSRDNCNVMLSLPANTDETSEIPNHRCRCPSPNLGAIHSKINNLNIMSMSRKRASSFKKPKEKILDNFLNDEMRPRTCSMPTRNTFRKPHLLRTHLGLNIEPEAEMYTVRSFKMNSKGELVNRGDSLRSRSTNSVFSSEGDFCPLSPSSRTSSSVSRDSVGTSPGSTAPNGVVPARILVLGDPGVGKTALTQQFMTSEYLGGFDTSIDGETEKVVNVLLDGEETALCFLVQSGDEPPNVDYDNVAAFVLVYASDDKESFEHAVDTLYSIRKTQNRDDVVIIFVGNKSDLVRSRCVTTEEAKAVAITYDCKFVETSVVLNMNVDELLVGVVKQIRIRAHNADKAHSCAAASKLLLNKIFRKDSLSKSCENLYR